MPKPTPHQSASDNAAEAGPVAASADLPWAAISVSANPDQRSLYEQVSDLWRFARAQKMYDAQDWLAAQWTGDPLPGRWKP